MCGTPPPRLFLSESNRFWSFDFVVVVGFLVFLVCGSCIRVGWYRYQSGRSEEFRPLLQDGVADACRLEIGLRYSALFRPEYV